MLLEEGILSLCFLLILNSLALSVTCGDTSPKGRGKKKA